MTKQEAIDVLQNTIVRFGRNNGKTVYAEALGMAIEALSNSQMQKGKKMDDCISRQAAIDAVSRGCQEWRGIFADCEENLNELPSAQPESRCNTCRYTNLEWYEEPCDSCTMGGESNHYKPSAQRTGEWITVTNGRGGHECDQCHNYAPAWQTGEERLTDFCPNCGAEMKGESNEI